jgi:outer membrane protein OmpA-like peptidoglycan-associated protein
MHCRMERVARLALVGCIVCLVGCASQPGAQQKAGRLSAPRSSHGGMQGEPLRGLESALRSRLASTDAVVLADSGFIRVRVIAAAIFLADAADLSSAAGEVLQPLAATLVDSPATSVEVRAYTDDLDSSPRALALTQQRADMVALYFTQHGIATERIHARGEGQAEPVEGNTGPEGRRANRRVEILISALSS